MGSGEVTYLSQQQLVEALMSPTRNEMLVVDVRDQVGSWRRAFPASQPHCVCFNLFYIIGKSG